VERALDAGAVVVPERADVVDDVGDVRLGDLAVEQLDLRIRVARLRPRSMTTSMSCSGSVRAWIAATISGGSAASRTLRSSVASRRSALSR
jgi:hypothetical protein